MKQVASQRAVSISNQQGRFNQSCHRRSRVTLLSWRVKQVPFRISAYDVDNDSGEKGYKFVKFSSPAQSSLRETLASFSTTFPVETDALNNDDAVVVFEVKTLTNEWIDHVADLLTESFADSMGYLNAYKKFLRNQIGEYLSNHVLLLPKTVILVGIVKTVGSSGEEEHQTLVGTVEVSFDASTRSKHLTLNPPPDMPYLCNMAVEPDYRRRGFGAMLLEAAEAAVIRTGYRSMYLHVRHADPPAVQLYRKYGYLEEGEDWTLVQLLGLDRRYLLKKYLNKKSE